VTQPGFASVVLDVDSTLCGIEGIDWLAARRGADLGAQVTELTDRAMRGEITLDAVYGERLSLVQPTRAAVAALADAYLDALAPGAERAVQTMIAAGRRVVLVSGGLRDAILPVAYRLGVPPEDVCAVSVQFDSAGGYVGYDASSPLATATGKRTVAESLALPRRVLAMGDGATDLAMRPAVDAFVAYVGFVNRASVVASADDAISTFDQLVELVLG
jgi:phosphoserine phosphatase